VPFLKLCATMVTFQSINLICKPLTTNYRDAETAATSAFIMALFKSVVEIMVSGFALP
jgi:hypothetical protein